MFYLQGKKVKETLLPSLNLLTESARIHRETRKFLRVKVGPTTLSPTYPVCLAVSGYGVLL